MKKKAFSIILILILLLCNSCGTASVDTPSAVSGQSEQIDGSLNDDTDMPDTDSSIDMNSEPVKLLSRLETAYNDLDLYAIAACFEPAAMNAYFAVMKLLGVETEGLKEMMPFASKILAQSGMIDSENWGTVKLTPLDYSLQGLSGSITYQVDLNYIDGASITLEDTAAIVTDGIFYGLYTADGLVGEGIQYNKITYGKSSDKYFMELGAAVEQYRIGRDGTINKIE